MGGFLHLRNPLVLLDCVMLPPFALLPCPNPGISFNMCQSGIQAQLLSLPLQFAQWGLHPDPSLLLCPLGPHRALDWVCSYYLCFSPSCLPCSLELPTTCEDLSDIFVGGAGILSLNYNCPTYCNFERRELNVLFHTSSLLTSLI